MVARASRPNRAHAELDPIGAEPDVRVPDASWKVASMITDQSTGDDELVAIPQVHALGGVELYLTCRVTMAKGQRSFVFPAGHIAGGSEVQNPGDRGTLIIPRWLARDLGLIALVAS